MKLLKAVKQFLTHCGKASLFLAGEQAQPQISSFREKKGRQKALYLLFCHIFTKSVHVHAFLK